MTIKTTWQHLDRDGIKIVHGAMYTLLVPGGRNVTGRVLWTQKHGYIIRDVGREQTFQIPFRHKTGRTLTYPALVRVKESKETKE